MKKKAIFLLSTALTVVTAINSFAYGWKQTDDGRWWLSASQDDTKYYANGWKSLMDTADRLVRYYYFDEGGYLLTNTTTPDGRQVNENGEYVLNGIVQTTSTDDEMPGFEKEKKAIVVDTSIDTTLRADVNGWKQFEDGTWKYGHDGQWLHNGVYWISCTYPGSSEAMMECYSFYPDGVMRANSKLGSRSYNSDGKWVKDGEVVSVNAPLPADVLTDMEMPEALRNRGENEIADWLYSGGPKPSDSSSSNGSSGGRLSREQQKLLYDVTKDSIRDIKIDMALDKLLGL